MLNAPVLANPQKLTCVISVLTLGAICGLSKSDDRDRIEK